MHFVALQIGVGEHVQFQGVTAPVRLPSYAQYPTGLWLLNLSLAPYSTIFDQYMFFELS